MKIEKRRGKKKKKRAIIGKKQFWNGAIREKVKIRKAKDGKGNKKDGILP